MEHKNSKRLYGVTDNASIYSSWREGWLAGGVNGAFADCLKKGKEEKEKKIWILVQ